MELISSQSVFDAAQKVDHLHAQLIEHSPFAALIVEIESLTINLVNRAASNFLCGSMEEISGRSLIEFTDDFCANELREKVKALGSAEISKAQESLPFTCRSGAIDETPVTLTLARLGEEHVAVYFGADKPVVRNSKSARDLIDRELILESLSGICYWEVDLQSGKKFWSADLLRLFELDSYEDLEADYVELAQCIHPSDRERMEKLHQLAANHGQGYYTRFRIITRSGEVKTIQDRCKAEFDTSGNPVRLIGATRDISDIQAQEDELIKLHEIVNALPSSVMVTDPSNGELCFANSAAARKYKTTQSEMIGKKTRDIIGPELHEKLNKRYIDHLTEDDDVTSLELDFTTDAESPEWYKYIMRRVTIDDRTFVISISIDISDRKRNELDLKKAYARVEELCRQRAKELDVKTQHGEEIERDLKLSEERFFDIASSLADGIWETDADLNFTYLEDSIAEILGIKDKQEFPGLLCSLVRENVTSIKDWTSFQANLDERTPFRDVRFRYLNPVDGEGYFSMNGVPVFNANGDFKGYRGTGIEVSADVATQHRARKIQSEILLAKEEAERANKAKSEFLSSMSHELRTPLNSILGFAQLLEMTCSDTDPKQQEYVNHILLAGQELLNLISQILELSTLEKGRISLRMGEVSVDELISESLGDVEFIAKQRKIRILDQRMPGQQWPLLWADSNRLKQVLINLLSNAIKFNLDGGTVTVSCEKGSDNRLRISVSDSGLGIPNDPNKNLFQPFERMGRETGDVPGSGVGLSIAKRIMDLIGGEINYTSRANVGTTFWIEVPIAKNSQGQKDERSNVRITRTLDLSGNDAVATKVLYIEDDPGSQDLMMHILKGMPESNIEIVQAHNAELGLALAEEKSPDVILMDINLPGMDGVDAVQRLKQHQLTRHIPVIAISGDESVVSDFSAGNLGFDDFIAKPLKIKTVQDAVNRLLEHRS